jgi:hypothetical protein
LSYIRGRYANGACALMDHLHAMGIRCQVSYNTNARKRNNTLIVHFEHGDRSKIPSEWNGFFVKLDPNPLTRRAASAEKQ